MAFDFDWLSIFEQNKRLESLGATALIKHAHFLDQSVPLRQLQKKRSDSSKLIEHFYYKMFGPKTISETESEDLGNAPKVKAAFRRELEHSCLFIKRPNRETFPLYFSDISSFFTNQEAQDFFLNPFSRAFLLEPFATSVGWDLSSTIDVLTGKFDCIDYGVEFPEVCLNAPFEIGDWNGFLCFALETSIISESFPLALLNRYLSRSGKRGEYSWQRYTFTVENPVLQKADLLNLLEKDVNRLIFEFRGRNIQEKEKWIETQKRGYVEKAAVYLEYCLNHIDWSYAHVISPKEIIEEGYFADKFAMEPISFDFTPKDAWCKIANRPTREERKKAKDADSRERESFLEKAASEFIADELEDVHNGSSPD